MRSDKFEPITVPKLQQKGLCALKDMKVNVDEGDDFVWCPEASFSCSTSCWHTSLMRGPILAGALKPAIRIKVSYDGLDSTLRLSADEFPTVGAIRSYLEEQFDMSQDEIGLFCEGNYRNMDNKSQVVPGQLLLTEPVAALLLRVSVPEGIAAKDGSPEGLQDVVVLVDGEELAKTDTSGECELTLRIGCCDLCLRHVCFAGGERIVQNVDVVAEQVNECVIFSDVHLYFYATEPELPDDDDDQAGIDNAEEPPQEPSTLVWICALKEQIPKDAVNLFGTIHSLDVSGQKIATTLPSVSEGLQMVAGIQAETLSSSSAAAFALSSLSLSIQHEGFYWRPKDPSPFVEREEELGGCEYVRLLDCPVAVGYLDPCMQIHRSAPSEVLELPVSSCRTVCELKTAVGELLKRSSREFMVYDGSRALPDDARVKTSMDLKLFELTRISVRLVTGCCGDAFADVRVELDGEAKGFTDSQGTFSSVATVGTHCVTFLICTGDEKCGVRMERGLTVVMGGKNDFEFTADVGVSFYCTDPDDEERSEDEEDCSPLYDPSCVWVAVDPAQIPDDAKPLRGQASCQNDVVSIDSTGITPVNLRIDKHDTGAGPCPLADLAVHCSRNGFCWCPKESCPLMERTTKLGGCEFLRLLTCPVAMGFLKPAVCIHFPAEGLAHFSNPPTGSLALPLETYGGAVVLKEHLAEELGEVASGIEILTKDLKPFSHAYFQGPTDILCVRKGIDEQTAIQSALDIFQRQCVA
jgi:hypothetical protein